jgi:hypothetical protein
MGNGAEMNGDSLEASSLREIEEYVERLRESSGTLYYRGQADKNWPLASSFERDATRFLCKDPAVRIATERNILEDFQRYGHLYFHHLPSRDRRLEWLSLLQHFGGATRLLDFTYSVHVAVYFAMETGDGTGAVWIVDGEKASLKGGNPGGDKCPWEAEGWWSDQAQLSMRRPFVFVFRPQFGNERLLAQQGVFLVPSDIGQPFMKNFEGAFQYKSQQQTKAVAGRNQGHRSQPGIYRILIDGKARSRIARELDERNINATSGLCEGPQVAFHLLRCAADSGRADVDRENCTVLQCCNPIWCSPKNPSPNVGDDSSQLIASMESHIESPTIRSCGA